MFKDENWVLTAAHCVDLALGPRSLSIIAGAHNRRRWLSKEDHQRIGVAEINIHEDWSRETLQNDIAMLRLKSPLIFNGSYTLI